jgi:hypothetical protein
MRCIWCGLRLVPAVGVYLELLAKGRQMCPRCGRFENRCTCLLP